MKAVILTGAGRDIFLSLVLFHYVTYLGAGGWAGGEESKTR